jgi:hypothetical protein
VLFLLCRRLSWFGDVTSLITGGMQVFSKLAKIAPVLDITDMEMEMLPNDILGYPDECHPGLRCYPFLAQVCKRWKRVLEMPSAQEQLWQEVTQDWRESPDLPAASGPVSMAKSSRHRILRSVVGFAQSLASLFPSLCRPATRAGLQVVVDFGHELVTAVHMPLTWSDKRPSDDEFRASFAKTRLSGSRILDFVRKRAPRRVVLMNSEGYFAGAWNSARADPASADSAGARLVGAEDEGRATGGCMCWPCCCADSSRVRQLGHCSPLLGPFGADDGDFVSLNLKHDFSVVHFGMMLGQLFSSLEGEAHACEPCRRWQGPVAEHAPCQGSVPAAKARDRHPWAHAEMQWTKGPRSCTRFDVLPAFLHASGVAG